MILACLLERVEYSEDFVKMHSFLIHDSIFNVKICYLGWFNEKLTLFKNKKNLDILLKSCPALYKLIIECTFKLLFRVIKFSFILMNLPSCLALVKFTQSPKKKKLVKWINISSCHKSSFFFFFELMKYLNKCLHYTTRLT